MTDKTTRLDAIAALIGRVGSVMAGHQRLDGGVKEPRSLYPR